MSPFLSITFVTLEGSASRLPSPKRDPSALLDKPYHTLFFYLPGAALDAIAGEANAPRIGDLSYKPGVSVNDVTISSLGSQVSARSARSKARPVGVAFSFDDPIDLRSLSAAAPAPD